MKIESIFIDKADNEKIKLINLSSCMRKILERKKINEKLYGEQNIIENMINIKMVFKKKDSYTD